MNPVQGTTPSQLEAAGPNQNPSLGFTTLSNFVPSQVSTKVQRLFGPLSRTCSALPKPIKVVALLAGGIATVVALKRFYNMKSTNQNNAEKDLNTVASAVEGKTSLKNEGVELSNVKEDPSVSDSAQHATLENQLDKVLPTDLVETAQQQQNPSSGITVLPQELLERIFKSLPSKNQRLMGGTCRTIRSISQETFEEQKKQVLSFLKRIWVTNFTPGIEKLLVDSKNFKDFSKAINSFYYSIYVKYHEANERFWKAKYEHTQLEDLSTIELLIEILRPLPHNPIMFLSDDFCSKLPLETVDRLVDKLIENVPLDELEKHLSSGFECSLHPHSRKLLELGEKQFSLGPQCQRFMLFASARLKDDKEFILKLIEEWKSELRTEPQICLRYASDRLKNDKDVVLAAVRKDGFCLEYASKSLRGDKEVVLAALQTNLCLFHFPSQSDWSEYTNFAFKRDYMTGLVPQALWMDQDIINLVRKKQTFVVID